MPTKLYALQQAFQEYLLTQNDSCINTYVKNNVEKTQRLSVYGNGYFLRLHDILAMDFPVLQQLMGEELFEQFSKDYLRAHPATHFSIRYLALQLIPFLKTMSPYNAHAQWYEMACFEWAMVNAEDAKDTNVLTVDELKKIPQEDWTFLQFNFHPSWHLLTCHFNTDELWQAHQEEIILPAIQKKEGACGIWRKNNEVYFKHYSSVDAEIMALLSQYPFGMVCEKLTDTFPAEEVPVKILEVLQVLISEKILIKQ